MGTEILPHISLAMIVRDAERTLARCLATIRPWVDELVVVDTGSLDHTIRIARESGAEVSTFPWCDDFSAARNVSLQRARGVWVVWMDADDEITAEHGQQLRTVLRADVAPDVLGWSARVRCPVPRSHSDVLGEQVRVIRNGCGIQFSGRVHEQLGSSIKRQGGKIACLPVEFVHAGADHSAAAKQRKFQRDVRLLELELAEHPRSVHAHVHLAMAYESIDQFGQAREIGRRCLDLSRPGHPQRRLAWAICVRNCLKMGDLAGARRGCQDGLCEYPGDPELSFQLARLDLQAGHLRNAHQGFSTALAADGGETMLCLDEGVVSFKAALNLVQVELAMGRTQAAESRLLEAVRRWPGFTPAWKLLGKLFAAQSRIDELEDLLPVLEAAGQIDLWCAWRARLAESRGDFTTANAILQSRIEEADDPLPALRTWLTLARYRQDESLVDALEEQIAHCAEPPSQNRPRADTARIRR